MVVILLLSFLVLIHELGHFLAARKIGVRVLEFGIGYPPRLAKLFKWAGTVFTFNWLPFGGFVRLAGDDAEGSAESLQELEREGVKTSELFHHKSQFQRSVVILAGALTNIFFGLLVFSATYMAVGIPVDLSHPKIDLILPGSPAEQAGLIVGDSVVKVDEVAVTSSTQLISEINERRGSTAVLEVEREGAQKLLSAYIRTVEETPEGEGSLGIRLTDLEFRFYPTWQMPFRGIAQGVKDSLFFAELIPQVFFKSIAQMITTARVSEDVAGPIGIVYTAQRDQLASQGFLAIINFAAVLSINLGIVNLLPIPALDGGRVVFVWLESLIGKARRTKIERHANAAGMTFLLVFIGVVSLKDIWMILFK